MQALQWVAALTGAVSVYLSTRENIWSWPTAIVNVTLSAVLFYASGLYSDAGLNVVYLALSIYGWYEWLHGGPRHTRLHVSKASRRVWILSAVVALVGWMVLARLTSMLPGVSLPYLDSGLATLSLVAQWMMTRKILENWILWIIVDVAYVPMYIHKELYPTAALYTLFLVLAVMGLVQWRRSFENDRQGALLATTAPA